MTNMLLIAGNRVTRYVSGKRKGAGAEIDPNSPESRAELGSNLNYMLQHGLPEEDQHIGAPEVPADVAGPMAITQVATQLEFSPPGMTPRYPSAQEA